MRITKTTRNLLLSLLVLVFVCAAFGYLNWRIQANGAELIKTMQLIEDAQTTQHNMRAVEDELAVTKDTRDALHALVLQDDKATVDLLTLVETIAREQGVRTSTDKLEVTEQPKELFDDLVLILNLEGSRTNVGRVVEMLNTLPRQKRMTALTIQNTTDPVTKGSVTKARVELHFSIQKGNS